MSNSLNQQRPLLSISIPTARRPGHLARLLHRLGDEISRDSSRANTIEVCVFNNGDCPQSCKIIEKFRHCFVNFSYDASFTVLDVGNSFDNAIKLASGQFIWLLGDDDLPLIGSITDIVKHIESFKHMQLSMIQMQATTCKDYTPDILALKSSCSPKLLDTGADILTTRCFHWLGQMSTNILSREFYSEQSLYGQRQAEEIIPLLRAVVSAIGSNNKPILCLQGMIFARREDAANWKGKMAFASSIEFPRYYHCLNNLLTKTMPVPFSKVWLFKMIIISSLLRDSAPRLWRQFCSVPSCCFSHTVARVLGLMIGPLKLRLMILNRLTSNKSSLASTQKKLTDWDSLVAE